MSPPSVKKTPPALPSPAPPLPIHPLPEIPPPLPSQITGKGDISRLIPYKNPYALTSYYLGVFALHPCLAFPLGIAAVIFGIRGLSFASRNPSAGGRSHARAGIAMGVLFLWVNFVLAVFAAMIWLRSR